MTIEAEGFGALFLLIFCWIAFITLVWLVEQIFEIIKTGIKAIERIMVARYEAKAAQKTTEV